MTHNSRCKEQAKMLGLAFALLMIASTSAYAQKEPGLTIESLSGTWVIDAEKSFSRSERTKLASYTLRIVISDIKVTLFWDYTIDGKRSNYSEELRADGREFEYPRTRGGDDWEPWSHTTKWKKGKLIREFSYRTTRQRYGSYRNKQQFALNQTGDALTVTTTFVNLGSPPSTVPSPRQGTDSQTADRKLVFNRKTG